jgi:hypothetical protein
MPTSNPSQLLTVAQAAARLGVSPRSLADKRWRVRVGLAATKIGRRVGFRDEDIARLIARGRERLPSP